MIQNQMGKYRRRRFKGVSQVVDQVSGLSKYFFSWCFLNVYLDDKKGFDIREEVGLRFKKGNV